MTPLAMHAVAEPLHDPRRGDRRRRRVAWLRRAGGGGQPIRRGLRAEPSATPEGFWAEAAADIDWMKPWRRTSTRARASTAAGSSAPSATHASTAVDRHVDSGPRRRRRRSSTTARSTGRSAPSRYASCCDRSARRSPALLRDLGVGKGDRVIIYMPMVPEAVFAMLACARIGAIHSVVFGGFAPRELATRIDDARPEGHPVGLVRHRARRASSPTSRCSTRRSSWPRTSPSDA